jgi:hypothetical protein
MSHTTCGLQLTLCCSDWNDDEWTHFPIQYGSMVVTTVYGITVYAWHVNSVPVIYFIMCWNQYQSNIIIQQQIPKLCSATNKGICMIPHISLQLLKSPSKSWYSAGQQIPCCYETWTLIIINVNFICIEPLKFSLWKHSCIWGSTGIDPTTLNLGIRWSHHLNLKGTGLKNQRLCCMYFCLPNIINSTYIQHLRELVPPPIQNTVCQITILILFLQ